LIAAFSSASSRPRPRSSRGCTPSSFMRLSSATVVHRVLRPPFEVRGPAVGPPLAALLRPPSEPQPNRAAQEARTRAGRIPLVCALSSLASRASRNRAQRDRSATAGCRCRVTAREGGARYACGVP
jgi:hypothetical protein